MEYDELFRKLFPSHEMADFLTSQEISQYRLIESINGAPISLQERLEIFHSLTKQNNDPFDILVHKTEEAIQALNTKPGEFFYVKNCWPDYENGDIDIGPMEPYPNLKSAIEGINTFLAEEECDESSCYWFLLEKWILNEAGQYVCPYTYTVVDDEVLYFGKEPEKYAQLFSTSYK